VQLVDGMEGMGSAHEKHRAAHDLLGVPKRHEPVWFARLRNDYGLAIVVLFGVCALLVILPFGIYRLMVGDFLIAAADGIVISLLGGAVVYAWRSGNAALVGNLIALILTIGFLFPFSFLGISMTWASPVIVANFLLASRYIAVIASILVVATLAIHPDEFTTALEYWSALATAALVGLFGMIFASRTELQRRKLVEFAERDSLTQTFNRRVLRDDLETLVDDNRLQGRRAAMAILDLDHFKAINDCFGHEEGDCVLMQFAHIVSETVRESDRLYRLGGEEFLLLLPDTDRQGLERALGKLQAALREQLRCRDQVVTVSMGAAVLKQGESIRSWVAHADKALYRAKRRGRDRVEYAGPDAAGAGTNGGSGSTNPQLVT
jgi:diguanylate cyclase